MKRVRPLPSPPAATMASRWVTPKRCCSSTTAKRRSRNCTPCLDKGMGPHDHVDRSRLQTLAHRPPLGRGLAALEKPHPHPVLAKLFRQAEEVLVGQHLGGRHEGSLAALLDRPQQAVCRDHGLTRTRRHRAATCASATGLRRSRSISAITRDWAPVGVNGRLGRNAVDSVPGRPRGSSALLQHPGTGDGAAARVEATATPRRPDALAPYRPRPGRPGSGW